MYFVVAANKFHAVFQYTFCVPEDHDGKSYVVMWDYDNGLVRITPFFKACKYSKVSRAQPIAPPFLHTLTTVP